MTSSRREEENDDSAYKSRGLPERRVVSFWRPRDPNVEGPGGFFFGGAQAPGALAFVAPANGTYRLSFSPCAMWGAPGMVKICAR